MTYCLSQQNSLSMLSWNKLLDSRCIDLSLHFHLKSYLTSYLKLSHTLISSYNADCADPKLINKTKQYKDALCTRHHEIR